MEMSKKIRLWDVGRDEASMIYVGILCFFPSGEIFIYLFYALILY